MRYFIDTEFAERPCTIDLISIGIVCEDGRELYLVSDEFCESACNEWVQDNVLPHLPPMNDRISKKEIKRQVWKFVTGERPEFWGYYCSYDWVVFCWLFGPMVELPKTWPMFCREIRQLADSLGNPQLPKQLSTEHDALNDARWNRQAYEFLT